MESADAIEAIETLKEWLFGSNGEQRKNAPAATINRYMELRSFIAAQGDDISEYPSAKSPPASPGLSEARMKDPNLAWDVTRRAAIVA